MSRYLAATFGSLRARNYRLYFIGQNFSVSGTWMQRFAQAWLVLDLSGSALMLGAIVAVQQVPSLLLAPWGGLIADRVDKRKVLIVTQAAAMVPALLLAVLTASGSVTIWMVVVLAVALGCIEALDTPARHTFVVEMVGRELLANALTLNSITQNAGKVVGPALAGVLIATVGMPYTFLLNAASYGATLGALALMRTEQLDQAEPMPRARGQLRDGLAYVRQQPSLLGPLLLMAVTGILIYNWQVIIPLLAVDSFGGDAQVAGWMFSAMGVGAMVGGLALAGALRTTLNWLVGCGLALGAVLAGVALSRSIAMSLILFVFVGAASIAFRSIAASVVQLFAEPSMRGRVVALLVMAFNGTTPLGAPLIGWMATAFGAWMALLIASLATVLAAGGTYWYLRRRMPAIALRTVPVTDVDHSGAR